MFLRLLDIESRKLLKHPLAWLELAGVPAILALYFATRYLVVSPAARQGWSSGQGLTSDLQGGLDLFRMAGILFYASTAAFIAAYDLPERGLQMWLARGVPRPLLLLARLELVLAAGFLLVIVAAAASLGEGALARAIFVGDYTAPRLDWFQLSTSILHSFWGAVPYLGLTLLLAVGSRSPLFAAGGAVVFRTVVENVALGLSDRFPALVRFLPAQLELGLQHHATEAQAALLIGLLLLCFTTLALAIFSRQDWGG